LPACCSESATGQVPWHRRVERQVGGEGELAVLVKMRLVRAVRQRERAAELDVVVGGVEEQRVGEVMVLAREVLGIVEVLTERVRRPDDAQIVIGRQREQVVAQHRIPRDVDQLRRHEPVVLDHRAV
jgi:hypothetical protein